MRKLLPLIIMVFLASSISAQYKPVVFGLKVGGNLGWMKADAEGYSSGGVVPGFTWGFIGEFFIMENYAILTGFNMSFNGGKMSYLAPVPVDSDTLPIGNLDRKYNLKYIQIPLCLKMQTEISEKLRLFGKIGIGTAFLLDAKGKDSYTYEDQEYTETRDLNDEMALMRESLIVGGGVEFVLKGSTALVLDLTYDNGFNNILTFDNPVSPNVNPRAFHNYLELSIGIIF